MDRLRWKDALVERKYEDLPTLFLVQLSSVFGLAFGALTELVRRVQLDASLYADQY